ncbi:hypothetical protein C0995_016048 [Termitomyces sp. Mi166|nr:hypothetical protein C0995_016048 [Termitomyces sp. Mi166\
MDYLRTLGSAAVSSLVQKSGLNLPFSLGPKVLSLDGVCNLYDGTKRDDGSSVSIFEYDFSDQAKKTIRQFATNALRKLRSTRHPDVLKFMDAVETDTIIYIMTERVRPLQSVLQSWSGRDAREREDWLLWGLHRISVALTFVNEPCASTHGKLCVNSIFISPSGEWKLGGFELFSNPKEEAPILYTSGAMYPNSPIWASPEVKKGGWYEPAVADAYALGLLLYAVFNPALGLPATAHAPHPPPTASSSGSIPPVVFPSFKKLLNPNPRGRQSPKSFLEIGMMDNGFFSTNKLVKVCLGLDNFALGSEAEKNAFLRALKESSASFPPEFTSNRILPSLVTALEYGGSSAAVILPLILQFGASVSPEEYPSVVLAPLVKLYASPDRGTRMALLDHLSEYVEKLDKKTVSEKIFPHLSTGFADTVAVIREATTKSIILLGPKLTDRILNNDLLRFLAKMQTDPEPSIRTNTCILIGRLGPTLGYHTKKKVLVPAFSRALRDTFVHARVAGLMAFMATIDYFDVDDIANRVIPNIAFTMIDKEKLVRDQAFKAIDLFVKKLENHAAAMPETSLSDSTGNAVSLPEQTTLVTTAAGAASSLAGWAISSLGKKLITSDLQTTIEVGTSTASTERPISAPTLLGKNEINSSFIPSTGSQTVFASVTPLSSLSRPKGMQLGPKVPLSTTSAVVAEQWADDTTYPVRIENPWGNDDLIDVNADEDDWSRHPTLHAAQLLTHVSGAFETAPAVVAPKSMTPSELDFGLIPRNGRSATHHSPSRNAISSVSFLVPTTMATSRGRNGNDEVPEHLPSPAPTTPSFSEMTKEEKAAEMARRKEERKQRIALLKEQKKGAVRGN